MTPEELEYHRQMLDLIQQYVEHNLRWERKGYQQDGKRISKTLDAIIEMAYLRKQEVDFIRKKQDEELREYKNSRELRKKLSTKFKYKRRVYNLSEETLEMKRKSMLRALEAKREKARKSKKKGNEDSDT